MKLVASDKFFDLFKGKDKRLQEFTLELTREVNTLNQKQMDINIEEAKHSNIFVAGWRPFIGWVCGSALAYQFVLKDLINYFLGLIIPEFDPIPTLDLGELVSIVFAMLGMSGIRTYEKLKKVEK